jgi:hypothetical protein
MTEAVSQTPDGAMETEHETEKQRIDRELIELLNELRVALPGVSVLFGFLLTLPFTGEFEKITGADRNVYVAAVVLTVLSTAFLTAPSAHHRIRFRDRTKEQILRSGTTYALIGLLLFAGALSASFFLIADLVYDTLVASLVAGGLGLFVVVLWFVVPLGYRPDGPD